MKKSLMLMAAMMISTFIFAQHQAKDPHVHAADQTERIKKVLSLNDAQYASIKNINEKYAAKQSEIRRDSSRNGERHAAMSKLRSERENEIQTVLTPEQKAKWQNYKTERTDRTKEHKQKNGKKYEAQMKSTLSLSDDQFVKIQDANKNFRKRLEVLRKDPKVTKDIRKTELKKINTEHETAVKGILTEQQFQKWTALKAEKRNKRDHKHK